MELWDREVLLNRSLPEERDALQCVLAPLLHHSAGLYGLWPGVVFGRKAFTHPSPTGQVKE